MSVAVKRGKLTANIARAFFRWERSTGRLFWKSLCINARHVKIGDEAGSIFGKGRVRYRRISIGGYGRFFTHCLIWLMAYGKWPRGDIDHQDGDGLNNKLRNLRNVGKAGNAKNRRMYKNNTSGFMGVRWLRHVGKWHATISTGSNDGNLGYFTRLEEAVRARAKALRRFGYHPNHGRTVA